MWNLLVVAILVTGALTEEYRRLSPEDYETLSRLPAPRASLGAGFKYKYVSQDGSIHDSKPSGHAIEIAASPRTGSTAHYDAALVISHQTRHMPSAVFSSLATRASVGVFTKTETMSVYPEYYRLKDSAACRGSCSGSCSASCTFDGRKWSTVAGAGGQRASILDDNVSCSSSDPYRHHENILIHEFTHTTHHYGLDSAHDSQKISNSPAVCTDELRICMEDISMLWYAQGTHVIRTAYNHAKSANLWRSNAYAMANYEEYFAEGATSFFNVNKQNSAGGMNKCDGHSYCTSEQAARTFMHGHDAQLYNLLSYTFTNNRPSTPSHLSVCQKN